MSFPLFILSILASLLWAIAIGGFTWYLIKTTRQITYITLADGRKKERKLPMTIRLLLPLAPNLNTVVMHPIFTRSRDKAQRDLITAGFEGLLSGAEYTALRIVEPICAAIFFMAFFQFAGMRIPFIEKLDTQMTFFCVMLTVVKPLLWLRKEKRERHRRIQRSLPFILDLLTLSVEAGLDFMSSLQRNVERRTIDDLGEELLRVLHEIRLGRPRRVALKEMAYRVNLSELNSVVNALVQADELGVSVGSILRIQSDQIRQRRFQRAEKLANEAPVKMLGPLFIFIFPSVLIILIAPIIVKVIGQF